MRQKASMLESILNTSSLPDGELQVQALILTLFKQVNYGIK